MAFKRKNLYLKIINKPIIFSRITGITPSLFKEVIEKVKPEWKNQQTQKTKTGRPYQLNTLENQLVALLMYYRVYVSQEYIGWLFNAYKATICRAFKRLTPLLARVIHIKKARKLSQEDLEILIVDATEQSIQRPGKKQKKYYSGKKKRHTIKTEMLINKAGRIVGLSKAYPGSVHDLSIRRREKQMLSRGCFLEIVDIKDFKKSVHK